MRYIAATTGVSPTRRRTTLRSPSWGRLGGVERRQLARGARDCAKMLGDRRQRLRHIDPAADDQQRIVGLVPGPVERLQPVDRNELDVRARANDRIAVVVPAEREPLHAGEQHAARLVLAHLELVADHGHLAVEVALRDPAADQPVGLQADRPVEVFVARGERLEVRRAVVRRGAVIARAASRQFLLDVLELVRILE
jgi:hypothetical protein